MSEACLPALLLLSAAAPPAAPPPAPRPAADTVLHNAAVYTVDAARSWAQAVAIREGRIVYVGGEAGVRAFVGPRTKRVDLGGRMVLPGFVDAHIHPVSSGVEINRCDLSDLPTAEAILAKVRDCAHRQAGPWVVGTGWSLPAFPNGAPTKEALDAAVPERPAFFSAADGHSGWVNSKALALAGITRTTPDPRNGRIERAPATGEPAGTLSEAATGLVEAIIPAPSLDECLVGLKHALELANRNGLTGLQEANAGEGPAGGGAIALAAYREAERRGELTAHVTVSLGTDPRRGAEQVDDLVKRRLEFTSRLVRPIVAKIFADGVIETRMAAMLEPYLDRGTERGELIWSEAAMNALVLRLAREDFNVHVHAIGDRAVRITLDAMEAARKLANLRPPRFEIAHLEVIHPDDLPRFRRLDVIANFQPLWAFADSYITELTIPALGPERSRWLYPIGSLARSGAVLAFGSDWSVSSLNPLEGIQVALTRQGPAGEAAPPLLPGEAIDLPTALAAYTIGAAQAIDGEREMGSVEVGKLANLVVLSDNLFELESTRIAKARVVLTLFEGRPVFKDGSLGF